VPGSALAGAVRCRQAARAPAVLTPRRPLPHDPFVAAAAPDTLRNTVKRATGRDRVDCLDVLFPPRLGEAVIRVIEPPGGGTLRVTFVLKTFNLAKTNDYAETSAPGLSGQPLQFLRGHSRTLSLVLSFDGRATNTDVRQPMSQVMSLMNVNPATHAPPVVSFEWNEFALHCVLESCTLESFGSALPDGTPSRGRMHVTFRERLTLEELLVEAERE
jgi:hypothetical protein